MSAALDQLEERVNAVTGLVRDLRREIARLEQELADRPVHAPQKMPTTAPAAAPAPAADDGLLREVSRLREERALARERIRGLIREIDQVTW